MATVQELNFLAEMEKEYGIEVSKGGAIPDGVYGATISNESEVRISESSGAPRLMVKTEINYPADQAGRKPTDFYGWFGKTNESAAKVQGMFLGVINDIVESAPSIDTAALATAFRGLPRGNSKKDYDVAADAMNAILAQISGHAVWLRVVNKTVTRTDELTGAETSQEQTRVYFLPPNHKAVLALAEGEQTV